MTQEPEVLTDPSWKPGETVTLKPGNRTWAMVQRANNAVYQAALTASGLSQEEINDIREEEGPQAAAERLDPFYDDVVFQLAIMRQMIVSWTLPYQLTQDGMEQLTEQYGDVIKAALKARMPTEVPRTEVGGFPASGEGSSQVAEGTPGSGEPGNDAEDVGSADRQDNRVDASGT